MRQAENCELYAIAGRSMEKAEAFRERYGFQGEGEFCLRDGPCNRKKCLSGPVSDPWNAGGYRVCRVRI